MLRAVAELLRIRLQRETAFRADFLLDALASALYVLGGLLLFEVIYRRVESIGGWSRADALALVGTLAVLLELEGGLLRGLRRLPRLIEEGRLEQLLLRPIPSPVLLWFRNANPVRTLMRLPSSAVLLAYALALSPPTPAGLFFFALALVVSLAIYAGLIFCLVCLGFWFYELNNLFWIVDDLTEFARYPESVYHGPIRVLLSTVLPLMVLANFPVLCLRQANPLLLGHQLLVLAAIVLVGWNLWRQGLARYQGAGG